MDAVVEPESLADERAEYDGEDGDERFLAREHPVHTDIEHAQRNALFHGAAQPLRNEFAQQYAENAACDDRGGVDDGTGQDHVALPSFSYPASVRITSPAIISPAQPGTHVRLAGTLRRPGGGASRASGAAGSSGE